MALEPKHLWMSLPVLLLLMSLSIGVTAVVLSSKGARSEVERDYYERGLQWDDFQEAIAASRNLGWSARFEADPVAALGVTTETRFVLTDGEGAPVTGAEGSVRAIHNADARRVFEGPVAEGEPGVYHFQLAPHRAGIWRWELQLRKGEVLYVDELRGQLFGGG